MVWLEAPYGYGKSVLSSQWAQVLETEGWRVLWLSLQGRDLTSSLAHLLALPEQVPWEVLLDALWQKQTLLVLEDLEGSENLSPLLRDVRGLLLIASRNTLPFQELYRLHTQQRLLHLQAKDLAFTPEEALQLFNDKDQARTAWERSQGWSLPLHFAALTGEVPNRQALLEGMQESLSAEVWHEALLLAALPYLPFDKGNAHTKDLAHKGFAQELESGFRLHLLAAETIQSEYLEDVQNIVQQENARLPLVLKAEAFARTKLFDALTDLLESELELAASDPQGFLSWDALCSSERGPSRRLSLAYAQSVLGQLETAYQSYEAVLVHPQASPDQKLIALGWWIFDLPIEDKAQFEHLLGKARTLFHQASVQKVGAFLFNASAFPLTNQDWEVVEALLLESLTTYQSCSGVEAEVNSIQNRLAQVRWELQGDVEQLILAIHNNLRFQASNPYNAPVNYGGLARLLALLSDPKAFEYFELAEQGANYNPAVAVSASAEKAALLGDSTVFAKLLAQFRPWQHIDPKTQDRLYALWAKTLRKEGKPQAALEVLDETQGLYAKTERALALGELGRKDALLHLPSPDVTRLRFLKLELQAARYLLTREEAELEALLSLTTSGQTILPALIPLTALPVTRPELAKAYSLTEVLASGWQQALEIRHHEIPDLELLILGKFEASVLGTPADLTDRHKAILALMALGYDRETIGTTLWPKAEGRKVLNNLHVQLNLLRKSLEPWGFTTYLTEEGLTRTKADIRQLQKALAQKDATTVLALYHEPLAPSVDLALIDEARESLREEVLACLFEAAQTTTDGIDYLERLLELDPLHEEALQLLLGRLVARGRKREAIKRYQTFAVKLKTDMGLEPLEETRALLA